MVDLAPVADLFEIRGDLVLDLDLLTILRAKHQARSSSPAAPRRRAGAGPTPRPRRRMTLLEAVKRGFDYVDVEYRSDFLDVMIEKAGNGLVVSYHDLEGTPDDLDEPLLPDVRQGRRHREDRGDAAVDRRRGPAPRLRRRRRPRAAASP